MAKATQAQKAERLNAARAFLHRYPEPRALQELIRRYSLSPRQAYRYLQQAQHLHHPLPVVAAKVAFTVKLPRPLVAQLRSYAARTSRSLSQTVSQALAAMLDPRRRRG
jgi:hypothetical protein